MGENQVMEVKHGTGFVMEAPGSDVVGRRASHCFGVEKIGRVQVC